MSISNISRTKTILKNDEIFNRPANHEGNVSEASMMRWLRFDIMFSFGTGASLDSAKHAPEKKIDQRETVINEPTYRYSIHPSRLFPLCLDLRNSFQVCILP